MMTSVFTLEHSYESDGYEETKFIGVYSSREEAEMAIERLKTQNGFKYHVDAFHIEEYEINKDHWTEGFATMTTIMVKSIKGEWKAVSAECLPNEEYIVVEKYENDQLGEFKDGDIVKCKEEDGELYAIKKVGRSEE